MAIDIQQEQLFSFKELASRQLRISRGKSVTVSMIHSWRRRGVASGIKLEAIKVRGVWCTSIEAFHRFKNAVTVVNGMRAIKQVKRPPDRRQPKKVGDKLTRLAERLSKANRVG